MYGSSKASSKDTNLFIPSPFKQSEGEMQQKNREIIGSDLHQHHHRYQHLNSGLMRFCSAPSSLIANYLNGSGGEGEEECDDFLHPRSSSPETERVYARFMSCGGGGGDSEIREEKSPAVSANIRNSQFMASMEPESEVVPQQNGYSPASQMLYKTSPPLPMPSHSSASAANESSYKVVNSMAMDHGASQVKTATGNFSNLIRHSSSPAGFSSHLTVENGYGLMRGVGNFRAGNGTNGEGSPTTSRLKGQRNFSSGSPSSSGLMSQISENGSESIGANSPDDGSLGNSNGGNRCYIPGFPIDSWEDSAIVSENFNGLKRARDFEGKMIPGLNSSDTQNGESRNRLPVLSHHLSLPKTSMELADVEKFLQFPDSVPCKVRAKRGCATHPRSIAERVRRTRISERMRKLQELVPNMDKQTNTADMLDLAVDYIKDLQKQVKKHTDNQAYCTCSCKQKPFSSPAL